MEFRHVAVTVADLRGAEEFYCDVFDLTLLGRETWGDDGLAHALKPTQGWEDAIAAGVEIRFVALQRDGVVLALLAGDAGLVDGIILGLVVDAAEIVAVRSRLDGQMVGVTAPDYLEFEDPFGVRWQLSTDRAFLHAGQIAGRWLDL